MNKLLMNRNHRIQQNENQEEHQEKRKLKQLIQEMKNILVVGNKSIGLVALKFLENLEEAKETITLINNEMEYHKKQTIKYALKAGECLLRIQRKNSFQELSLAIDETWIKGHHRTFILGFFWLILGIFL